MDKRGRTGERGVFAQQSVTTEKGREIDRLSAEETRQIGEESETDSTEG